MVFNGDCQSEDTPTCDIRSVALKLDRQRDHCPMADLDQMPERKADGWLRALIPIDRSQFPCLTRRSADCDLEGCFWVEFGPTIRFSSPCGINAPNYLLFTLSRYIAIVLNTVFSKGAKYA